MKVMILSVTAGFGHYATAKAVSDELASHGPKCARSMFTNISTALSRAPLTRGICSPPSTPKSCISLVYALAENRGTAYFTTPISILNIVNALGASKFARIVTDFNPDVLVCTHVFAAQVVNEIKKRGLLTTTTVGIITDYTIHPYWEDVPISNIVTASELLHHRSLKRGIEANRLLHFGIPSIQNSTTPSPVRKHVLRSALTRTADHPHDGRQHGIFQQQKAHPEPFDHRN